MSTEAEIKAAVSGAFAKLLKAAAEVTADLSEFSLMTSVKADERCGTFIVEVIDYVSEPIERRLVDAVEKAVKDRMEPKPVVAQGAPSLEGPSVANETKSSGDQLLEVQQLKAVSARLVV